MAQSSDSSEVLSVVFFTAWITTHFRYSSELNSMMLSNSFNVSFFSLQVLIDTQLGNLHLHLFLIKNCWGACMYSQQPRVRKRSSNQAPASLRLLPHSRFPSFDCHSARYHFLPPPLISCHPC